MADNSEQEIDLRPYLAAVADKKFWILGFGILGFVLGLALSSLLAPTYEATALIAVTLPRERVEFDDRIQTISDLQPLEAYPELALSDQMLVDLLAQIPADEMMTLTQLRRQVSASPGSDPSIVKLTVENTNPELAAEMANTWAALFVNWANQVYGYQGDEQLTFFEARLADAKGELESTEQALIDFQSSNRITILVNELSAVQQTHADYLAKQRQTDLILQDIESLLAQNSSGDLSNAVSIDTLASILLQVRALGGVPGSTLAAAPWQIQLNVDGQGPAEQSDQRQVIADLRDILVAQSAQIEERLAAIEPQILTVQQERQEADILKERLNRDYQVAVETYTTLARTVDEKRITSVDTTSGVKLASQTAVPERPSSPNVLLNAIIAGIAGLILSTLAVLLMYWWQAEKDSHDAVAETGTTVQLLGGDQVEPIAQE